MYIHITSLFLQKGTDLQSTDIYDYQYLLHFASILVR